MLFFGHVGITAGAARVLDFLVTRPSRRDRPDYDSSSVPLVRRQRRFNWLASAPRTGTAWLDYRFLLLGSLLPDIIDKSAWLIASRLAEPVALSGRDYAHTLLFNLVLLIGGLLLLRNGRNWLFIISISSFMHLILDGIWSCPEVLFWPLLGPLPAEETTGWLSSMIQALLSDPGVYVPEIIGLAVVALFAYEAVRGKGVVRFIREGTVV